MSHQLSEKHVAEEPSSGTSPKTHQCCGHNHHHDDHLKKTNYRALWSALIILGVFFFIELIGGLLTHSLALISDAAHLLTDVAALILALIAQWFAQKPASANHSYGYRRVEILAALLNGFTLILIAIYIAIEAYQRFQQPPVVLGGPMLLIASIGLIAQLGVAWVLHRAQGQSLNIKSAYLHALTDALQSIGVVAAGVVIIFTQFYLIDPLISVLLAVIIAYSGGKIIFEATHVLIEGTPRDINLGQVALLIKNTEGVMEVTDLHVWSLTSGYNALSAHVLAKPTTEDPGHSALRGKLTEGLCSRFPLQHVTVQIEEECDQCNTSNCCNWLNGDQKKNNGSKNGNKEGK